MRIKCSNGESSLSIGNAEIWRAVVSTINQIMKQYSSVAPMGLAFINSGLCLSSDCLETAKQINVIRDVLATYKPDRIVFDEMNPSFRPSWADKISPVITSCANYFTTSEGHDLLSEIVVVLCVGYYSRQDVLIE